MDTSETYIKMHLALPKDLQQEPSEGDYYYDRETGKAGGRMGEKYFPTDKMIKLYEQDQLQEMMGKHLWQLNFDFIRWLCDEPYDGHIRHEHLNFTSMGQLWLAFVMHERYHKIWNGENWVAKN